MAKKTSRPGRTLLIFFISVAVLYGLAALGGTFKPQLGLDLSGGTQLTLVATSKDVTPDKLKEAASIIENRVNGSGVVEAQVTTQGNRNIVVEIPGKNRQDLVDSVKRTAQLRFRLVATSGGNPVIASGVPATTTPSPTATPTGNATGTATPTPTGTPTSSTTPKTSEKTATPNPRPAPDYVFGAHKKPTSKATKKPTASTTPTATPTGASTGLPTTGTPTTAATPSTTAGASVNDPLAWASNPGDLWLGKFAQYVCPSKGSTSPIPDSATEPLITCDSDGNKYLLSKPVIEGTSLKSASYGIPQSSTAWAVNLTLKGSARGTFATISRALFSNGGRFAIVLDGQVLSSPGFDGVISDGTAQITGSFTESSAKSLSNSLKFGALPIRFDPDVRVEVIGATLAGDQLSAGIAAGIIGMLIVMLYCLLYYRGLGFVVISSLVVAGAVTYATVLVLAKAAGFTLTLPGIAGLIVAVGITADSFIVYFERIRDEMRFGKSMRVAVEAGWVRARNTCLAADGVSLLAAVVLYIFAIGVVRGFAFALGISTIIDIVVFFWFTKPTVTLLAKRKYFNEGGRWSGLSPETLGIDGRPAVQGLAGEAV
ncbi:MAG: preprotein translocase subunit SecD [Marmoricola sp.]|nr:preprotein translocase subunit SecD [Marmoricola sp.]